MNGLCSCYYICGLCYVLLLGLMWWFLKKLVDLIRFGFVFIVRLCWVVMGVVVFWVCCKGDVIIVMMLWLVSVLVMVVVCVVLVVDRWNLGSCLYRMLVGLCILLWCIMWIWVFLGIRWVFFGLLFGLWWVVCW